MGNARGEKRDFSALQRRRFEALKLLKQGYNQSEVARRVKVCSQTVSRWARAVAAEGETALEAAGRAGRKPLLNETERERLTARLLEGPERLGYETPLWTCNRVAHLIEQEFGVTYHSGHVWKILRQLNWSPQRPAGRALERDEEAIDHWKRKKWPEIKKKPKKKGARSFSSTRVDCASGRTAVARGRHGGKRPFCSITSTGKPFRWQLR
jgi:transposase